MNVGKMRHRITVQIPGTPTRDAYGQERPTTPTSFTVWGEVRPLAGREAIVAQQLRPEATTAITLRTSSTTSVIAPNATFLFRGRTLALLQVLDVNERLRELSILAKEVITRG